RERAVPALGKEMGPRPVLSPVRAAQNQDPLLLLGPDPGDGGAPLDAQPGPIPAQRGDLGLDPDPVGDLVAGVRDARGRVAPPREDHVRAAFVDHRGRLDVPPAGARELFEHVVPIVAQAVGDDTAAGTEERVHTRRVPRFDELARPYAGERLLLLREPRVARAEAAEDLVPEVPPHQPVAERAGL